MPPAPAPPFGMSFVTDGTGPAPPLEGVLSEGDAVGSADPGLLGVSAGATRVGVDAGVGIDEGIEALGVAVVAAELVALGTELVVVCDGLGESGVASALLDLLGEQATALSAAAIINWPVCGKERELIDGTWVDGA